MTKSRGIRRRALWAVVVTLVLIGLLVSSADNRRVSGDPGPTGIQKVVVLGIPALSLDDLDTGVMPNLDRVAEQGAIAATNVGIRADAPNLNGAYATLGAGNRTRAYPGEVRVASAEDRDASGRTLASSLEEQTGLPVEGPLVVPDHPAIADAVNTESNSQAGALTGALRGAGLKAAIVTNAGSLQDGTSAGELAPVAMAAAGADGSIDGGSVSRELIDPVAGVDAGVSSPEAFADAVGEALDDASVVFVDPGDHLRTERRIAAAELEAELVDQQPSPDQVEEGADPIESLDPTLDPEELRLDDLRRADRVLGRLDANLDRNTLLMVVGITPAGDSFALTPLVITGQRVPAGYLDSPSTHRPALVALTDLAPTILDSLGVAVPSEMIGEPLRYRTDDASWDEARQLDNVLEQRHRGVTVMASSFGITQLLLYGSLLVLLVRGGVPRRFQRLFCLGALVCAAWPLSTFILGLAPSLYGYGGAALAVSWAIAFAVGVVAMRFDRHPLDPLLLVCGTTVAVLVLDLVTGAHLQLSSFFGYTPSVGSRFTGIGNASFAILGGCTVATMVAIVNRAQNRLAGWWIAAGLAALVILVDGAPWIGADVGGILTFTPIFGLVLWTLRGGRIRARALVLAAAAAAAVLAVVVGLEALRDPADRSHIGRFFLNATGDGVTQGTLRRKWDANTRLMAKWPVLWAVPFAAVGAAIALVRSRVLDRVAPPSSDGRTAFVGIFSVGLFGWLVNDSGLIVLGLAAVYLGPLVALLIRDAAEPGEDVGEPPEEEPGELGGPQDAPVVALVPAKDREDSIAETVAALSGLEGIDAVVVVDDGSSDGTAVAARAAGAHVLRLGQNHGKGGAVAAGVEALPDAEVFVLIDADVGPYASEAALLLAPVLADEADLVIGVLPSPGTKGGFGNIRKLSRQGIRRACGFDAEAPLSGQRAIRAGLLRDLPDAGRFGLEVAMTIDVVRSGARVIEIPVAMEHRHTGRSVSGFRHRGSQGLDIVRSLAPRLLPRSLGILATLALVLGIVGASGVVAIRSTPTGAPLSATADRVVVFGVPGLGIDDVTPGQMPERAALADTGALAMTSVRTAGRSSDLAAYATLGAGDKVAVAAPAGVAGSPTAVIEGDQASRVLQARIGREPTGEVLVPWMPEAVSRAGDQVNSRPGALGSALHRSDLSTGVVANGAARDLEGHLTPSAPAVVAVADRLGQIDHGSVSSTLLRTDQDLPSGLTIDADRFLDLVRSTAAKSSLTVVDPGETQRAIADGLIDPDAAEQLRVEALQRTDRLIGDVADGLPRDTLLIVVGTTPPPGGRLTPTVMVGPGVAGHRLSSPSTRQRDLITLTDLAPTILQSLGVDEDPAMIGQPVRFEEGRPDLDALVAQNSLIKARDHTYGSAVRTFVWVSLVVYLLGAVVLVTGRGGDALRRGFGFAVLVLMAWPVSTYAVRAIPALFDRGALTHALLWAVAVVAALLAERQRNHALAPLLFVAAITAALITVDLLIGGPLQVSSYLGYTPSVGARFVGLGNPGFGVLAGAALLVVTLWGARPGSPRRLSTVSWAVGLLTVMTIGAPWLGSDIGGTLSMVPALGVALLLLSGRRITVRAVTLLGAVTASFLALAIGIEALRPAEDRTHIGRFFLGAADGGGFFATVSRKWSVNISLLTSSRWAWLLAIIGLFALVVLVGLGGWRRFISGRRHEVAAVVSLLTVTALGWATNDSGTVAAALTLSFFGPLIATVALRGDVEGQHWLPALEEADNSLDHVQEAPA